MKKKAIPKKKRSKSLIHPLERVNHVISFEFFILAAIGGFLLVYLYKEVTFRAAKRTLPRFEAEAFLSPTPTPAPTGIPTVQPAKKFKLPIVMYHYVEYVKDENDTIRRSLSIKPHLFERHLQQLKENGYDTYFVRDVPDILNERVTLGTRSAILTFDDGYEDFYTDAFPLLQQYQIKATVYVITDFIGRNGFMNKRQLKEIADSGLVEIGSHTLNHLNLKYVSSDEAKRQIFESKETLIDQLNVPVKTFAYPAGGYDEVAVELVREASYSAAVSVITGQEQSKDNKFLLKRIRAGSLPAYGMDDVLQGWQE